MNIWEVYSIQGVSDKCSIITERFGWNAYRVYILNKATGDTIDIKYCDSAREAEQHVTMLYNAIS